MTASLRKLEAMMGGFGTEIVVAFSHMAIAEEVITESGCSKADGQRAFGILCPSEPLEGKADDVYRSHARELVARVVAGENTRPGTTAEVLCCLLGAALKAPLDTSGLALADWLFAEVFPGNKISEGEILRSELYEGQVQADLQDARKRCGVADRVAS